MVVDERWMDGGKWKMVNGRWWMDDGGWMMVDIGQTGSQATCHESLQVPFNRQLALIGERPIQMMEKQALGDFC